MGELMKTLAACVGVFSHSAVNNDMLKGLQKLGEDLHCIYELIRRNGEVSCVLNFVLVLCLFVLNSLVLVCVAAVMHEILYIFILRFCSSVARH